jgi:hypothetical protein
MRKQRIVVLVVLGIIAGVMGVMLIRRALVTLSPPNYGSTELSMPVQEKPAASDSPIILPTVNLENPYGSGDGRILGNTVCDKLVAVVKCLDEKQVPSDFSGFATSKPYPGDPEEIRQVQCSAALTQLNPVRDRAVKAGCIW